MKKLVAVLPLFLVACIGDVELAPPAPTLYPVESPTSIPRQEIGGTKQAGTAVLNHGELIAPRELLEESQALSESVLAGEVVHKVTRRHTALDWRLQRSGAPRATANP